MSVKMTKKRKSETTMAALVVCACLFGVSGCQQRTSQAPPISSSTTTAATPTVAVSEYERDLNYVRKAQLAHTYTIARQDGAPLDQADKEFLVRNTPLETTMRIITDGGRRAIISANFDLTPENAAALAKRFTIEKIAAQ